MIVSELVVFKYVRISTNFLGFPCFLFTSSYFLVLRVVVLLRSGRAARYSMLLLHLDNACSTATTSSLVPI